MAGETKIVDYPEVKEVADKLGATPAQVLIAWGVYRGYSVIPKSVNKGSYPLSPPFPTVLRFRLGLTSRIADRIISNFSQITLSQEDYEKVSKIGVGRHKRFNTPGLYKPTWGINLFDEEGEKDIPVRPKVTA